MAQTEQRQREETDERSPLESVDDPMVCRMRLILALSALLIIYIDPSEPDRHVEITYLSLVLYSLYSAVLYYLAVYHRRWLPTKIDHWIDVGWYVLFIALSSGTSSIFFFFFFFAILISSFHWGFKTGVCVTLASTLLFSVVGYATAPAAPHFELNRFLLRPIYLLVLGYMMAYWGGCEIMLKRRLMLLKGVIKLSNPRFGVQHTIGSVIKKLRDFYDADACLLVMAERNGSEHHLYRVERDQTEGGASGDEPIPAELARLLLALPETIAARYCGKRLSWPLQGARYNAYDLVKREHTSVGEESSAVLADTFEADAFITAPLSYRGHYEGRLYLTASRRAFDDSDLEFIAQVIEQVMPVLDNIRLLDRLASNAAEQERQRLARDIHDSVIQPYIGLQYRLAAIRNKLQANGGNVADDIERLFQITVDEISGLRGFVRGLKGADLRTDDFLSAVRRFAKQFTDHFDIDVKIESSSTININDRLAAEVIQMIYEGLSNIRKHTRATSSTIHLSCNETNFFLSIENDGDALVAAGEETAPFTPGSITGRAEALGGHARVKRTPQGHTSVEIEIPL